MRRLLLIILPLAALAACNDFTHPITPQSSNPRWVAYYDKALPASTFKGYDLVVFDRNRYPDFKSLKKNHTTVLAYVSVGEVNNDVPEKKILEDGHALIGSEKTIWNSYPADLSRPAWRDFVMAQVSDAQRKGFDGVMLDTLDAPMGRLDKASDREWAQAQEVKMIREIRTVFPDMKIMMNRGFAILPEVASSIDYELAESTLAQTDVSTGQSSLFPRNSYQFALAKLRAAREASPQLKIFTLDYWNQNDVGGLAQIYATQRAQGFIPYVTTPDLRRYTPEPGAAAGSMREERDA